MPLAFSAATIVALGKFDPDLFRLDTLVESKVISAAEAERSRVKALLPKQVSHITFPWGELLVTGDRLQATATEAPFIRIADLVVQTMNIANDRCALQAYGVNFEAHFDIGSMEARDVLAMKFAPPDAWGGWGRKVRESMKSENPELHGGVAVLTMRELFRSSDIRGWYDVTLTTSDKVPNNTGVQFRTNHHHEYSRDIPPAPELSIEERAKRQTAELLKSLANGFDESINKGEHIFAEVLA